MLNNVVDDSGYKCVVGEQQDSMEYLMNFMERLEEGLSENSSAATKHLRVSTYKKGSSEIGDNPSESLLMDNASDLAESTEVGSENGAAQELQSTGRAATLPGYSHIDDSYF